VVSPVSSTSPARAPEGSDRAGVEASGVRKEARSARTPEIQMSAVVKTGEHSWSLYFPAGMEVLNSNQRLHWARKGAIVKRLRTASWALARNHVPALDRVRIVIEYQPPKVTRKRDAGNLSPTGKALIDGLRDAKVLVDDDSEHVLEEAYRIGEPCLPFGRVVMHITEVP
jgi:crossover junction endodeoxyribonuclease RusA